MSPDRARSIRLFLCGDVMTGTGVDQVLPHPGSPVLYEPFVRDAREYVRLAEEANGPVTKPVEFGYVWGDAAAEWERAAPDVRVVNLETSITAGGSPWPGKMIHYRMHPGNIGCLTAAGPRTAPSSGATAPPPLCCCLANNHVLDWGYEGLADTLRALDAAGLPRAGAGRSAAEAAAPAVLDVPGKGRVLVFAFGSADSGIPWEWAATADRPGVNLLEDLSDATARRVAGEIRRACRPGDVAVASIHWGDNWGYEIPAAHLRFAHRLAEEGVAIVHGHSSHHVKAAEVHRGRLILYGCGDFLTDYEGIRGYEEFRNDLSLMYFAEVDPRDGRLLGARLVPMQLRRFRLNRASAADARWLCELLNRLGAPLGTRARLAEDNSIALEWA